MIAGWGAVDWDEVVFLVACALMLIGASGLVAFLAVVGRELRRNHREWRHRARRPGP